MIFQRHSHTLCSTTSLPSLPFKISPSVFMCNYPCGGDLCWLQLFLHSLPQPLWFYIRSILFYSRSFANFIPTNKLTHHCKFPSCACQCSQLRPPLLERISTRLQTLLWLETCPNPNPVESAHPCLCFLYAMCHLMPKVNMLRSGKVNFILASLRLVIVCLESQNILNGTLSL